MMPYSTAKFVVQLLSAVAAAVSAGLWLWASRVKVPFVLLGGSPLGGNPGVAEVIRQSNRQAKLNGQAALATGISGLLQAIALAIPNSCP